MSESIMDEKTMYDQVREINELNKVEGFDPRKFMRLISKEGKAGKYYLDVAYRKLWFRLRYPEGKIVKRLVKLTDQVAIVEARVYLHRNDTEDNFISNALAQKYQTSDNQFGNKYVELAETAAVGRALSDAGFGLQFADMEEDFDPEVTEAPIEAEIMKGESMIPQNALYQVSTAMDMQNEGIIEDAMEDDNTPRQYGIVSYMPVPNEVGVNMQQGVTPAIQQSRPVTENRNIPSPVGDIRKDMPIEQIYSMLNKDVATSVVVPIGFNKGKTLGQVAIEKPDSLEWYVRSYGGPDNLLRAAAKFLLDTALVQAS